VYSRAAGERRVPARTTHALANTGEGRLQLLELHTNGRVIDEAAEHAA
jgi:mannose-6-phosphate isomerase-like protein (cupin superfamily)